MISLSKKDSIYLAIGPIDFRRQINGLVKSTKEIMKENPYNGAYFVFRNRRKTSIKILHYDGQGFWLIQKRLSAGKFFWPKMVDDTIVMSSMELQVLLMNGNPEKSAFQDDWRKVV